MAKELRRQVMKGFEKMPDVHKKHYNDFTEANILKRIHYIRILDESYQNLLRDKLEQVVEKIPNLKLIVMDTFSEHLRGSEHGFNERRRAISHLVMTLQRIAARHSLCIVLTNSMKTGKREFI